MRVWNYNRPSRKIKNELKWMRNPQKLVLFLNFSTYQIEIDTKSHYKKLITHPFSSFTYVITIFFCCWNTEIFISPYKWLEKLWWRMLSKIFSEILPSGILWQKHRIITLSNPINIVVRYNFLSDIWTKKKIPTQLLLLSIITHSISLFTCYISLFIFFFLSHTFHLFNEFYSKHSFLIALRNVSVCM